MVVVGVDYGHAGQMTFDEITGGAPYGASSNATAKGRAKNRRVEVVMPTNEALQQPPPNKK